MRFVVAAIVAILPCVLPAQQAMKIAVINGQAALVSTQEGKKAFDQLKAKVEAKRKEFELRQNELVQLEDQLNKSGAVIASDKKDQLATTINDKKKRLQRDSQDADEDAQKDQVQFFQPIEDRLNAIINKYAADNGYSLVIDINTPGSPVRYAATAIDITKDVVALYDKSHPR
jgi:outer membrane protein